MGNNFALRNPRALCVRMSEKIPSQQLEVEGKEIITMLDVRDKVQDKWLSARPRRHRFTSTYKAHIVEEIVVESDLVDQ